MKNLRVETSLGYFQDDYMYKENIKHLRGDTYYYADWGNLVITGLEDLFEIPTTNKKRTLIKFLKEVHYYDAGEFGWAKNIEDVISEIMNTYSLENMKDFVCDLEDFGIEVTPKFERYVSKGYSQGDCIEVFISHKLIDKWGCTEEQFHNQLSNLYTDIDHWCWDSEIIGQINISFSYEVKRESFGDSVIMEFDEEFEYSDWAYNNYEVEICIDTIIKYIDIKCMGNVGAESLELIRKELEAIDYTDVRY